MTQRTYAQHYAGNLNLRPRVTVDPALKAKHAHQRQPITRPNQPTEASRLVPPQPLTCPRDFESFWLSRLFRYPMPKDAATAVAMSAAFWWHVDLFASQQRPAIVTVHTPTGNHEVDTEAGDDELPFGEWEDVPDPMPNKPYTPKKPMRSFEQRRLGRRFSHELGTVTDDE